MTPITQSLVSITIICRASDKCIFKRHGQSFCVCLWPLRFNFEQWRYMHLPLAAVAAGVRGLDVGIASAVSRQCDVTYGDLRCSSSDTPRPRPLLLWCIHTRYLLQNVLLLGLFGPRDLHCFLFPWGKMCKHLLISVMDLMCDNVLIT